MPADTPMVLVPREPTGAMHRAAWRACDNGMKRPKDWAEFNARVWSAMLSASPAREGDLGSSASPIPTEQAGGPVVGWHPIETAPRDGSRFLARCGDYAPFECEWNGERFVHYDPEDGPIAYKPDQWRPLTRCRTCNGSGFQRVDDLSERSCVGCGGSGLAKDREAKRAWISAAAARPTPATPEGLREAVTVIRELLADEAGGDPVQRARDFLAALQPQAQPEPCGVPPEGWFCTRQRGHDGPCAAWPASGRAEK